MKPVALPLISCIVPTFNSEKHLAHAIDSIFAQTYAAIEVIVADDGSSDGTAQVVEGYGERVRFVQQATAGPAATRNLGLSVAHGEFAAFLDADDLWHHEKLTRQVERFRERPELDLCISYVKMFSDEPTLCGDHPRVRPQPDYATTTLLARRSLFDRVGQFDPSLWFADSTDWFQRTIEKGAVIEVVPDVLTFHRARHTRRYEFLRKVKASLDNRRELGVRPLGC